VKGEDLQLGVTPATDDVVVITAIVDGELQCAIDDTGAMEVYSSSDPDVQELVQAARDAFGPSARAMPVKEFRALAAGRDELNRA
jgi:hypothetical protein